MRRRLTRFGVIVAIGALAGGVTAAPATLAAGTDQTYLIVYQAKAVPSDAAKRISAAGGTLVASYNAIGVAIARSSSDAFKANVKADSRVAAAAATAGSAVQLNDDQQANDSAPTPNTPAVGSNLLLSADANPSDGFFSVVTAGEEHRDAIREYLDNIHDFIEKWSTR